MILATRTISIQQLRLRTQLLLKRS